MPNVKPAPKRRRAPQLAVAQNSTTPSAKRAPLLPHEHDEASAGEEKTTPDPGAVQGYVDVANGLVDTDRRQDAQHVFNAARRKGSRTRR